MSEWQEIETAPKDGKPIQVKIPGYGSDNIIAWHQGFVDAQEQDCGAWCFVEEQEPPNCWTDGVCWEANERDEKSVQPTHWKARV